jgi:hypothetical protein
MAHHRLKDLTLARKFLYVVATLIVLVLAAAFAYRLWGDQLMRTALVPSAPFTAPAPRSAADYASPTLWFAHGDIKPLALPAGVSPGPARPREMQAAVFFVHPTSFIDRSAWNVPDTDETADRLARQYISIQANVFVGLGPLWAPRYRQATFGAFLTDKPEAEKAFDAAYGDVAAAFDAFLAANPSGPIILAAHSQGSRHLMRLLAQRIAGRPVAHRIAAAYLVGWPISVTADLPALGSPACSAPSQSGCILSWQSFAEPADPSAIVRPYDAGTGLTGKPRRGSPMLCTNPLGPEGNQGMLQLDKDGQQNLVRPGVNATCRKDGFLIIEGMPDLGPFVLPGNNYHVYDYALFWANVRVDAARRLDAFLHH